jgi:single-strand DNA-binding protein
MINNFVGVGRLTAPAELKYTGGGTACMKFSICINKSIKKGDQWEDKPNFFNCVVWGKYAEAMQKHMEKGRRIGIEGELSQNTWTDNNGAKHNDVNIIVNSITLLESPKRGEDNTANNAKSEGQAGRNPRPEAGSPNDEIPF